MKGKHISIRKRLGLKLFKGMYDGVVERHKLRTLFWECTLRCNLRCRHCGSDCRTDASLNDMPLEDFLRVLDNEVTPNTNPSRVLIIFSGGEVLVRPDLEEAGREVKRRGYKWGMVTNGMALTRERLNSLIEAGLCSVSVSLDGFEDIHNDIRQNPLSYSRALEALRLISKTGLAYDAITCVTPALVDRLEEWKELLINNGIRNWRIFSVFPAGRAKRDEGLHLNAEQFRKVMEFIRSNDSRTKYDIGLDGPVDYIPTKRISLPVDKDAAIASGIVKESDRDLMVDTVYINLKKSSLSRSELFVVDGVGFVGAFRLEASDLLHSRTFAGCDRPRFVGLPAVRRLCIPLCANSHTIPG